MSRGSCYLPIVSVFGLIVATTTLAKAGEPCWLNQPAVDGEVAAFGLARDLNVGSGDPIQFSRYRALQSVSAYLGGTQLERTDIDIDVQKYVVAGKEFFFSDEYHHDGYVYSHISDSYDDSGKTCAPSQCEMLSCEPAWLCQPGDKSSASLLGLSYRASSLPEQFDSAVHNVMTQLEPIYGLSIEANDRFFTHYSSIGTVRLVLSDEGIEMNRQASEISLRYIISDVCWQKEQLFIRVNFPDLLPLSSVPAQQWMHEPNTGGFEGAIGSVNGRIASGLLSDKVKLAIKRGLIALAQSTNSSIKEELLIIKRKSSLYQLSFITQDTAVSLHARVNGLYFSDEPSGVAAYAWVVKTEVNTLNQ